MKSWARILFTLLMASLLFSGCSNASLKGPWIGSNTESEFRWYLITDGKGNITDIGGFETQGIGYKVNPFGTFSVYVVASGIPGTLNGKFISKTHATTTFVDKHGETSIGNLDKVIDPSICEGTWTGSMVTDSETFSIEFVIDSNGAIIDYTTDFIPPVSGHIFSIGDVVTGFFRTGSSGGYEEIKIAGILSDGAINGTFRNNDMMEGTVQLLLK